MKNKFLVFLFLIGFTLILGFRKKIFSGLSAPKPETQQTAVVEPAQKTRASDPSAAYMSPMLGAIQPKTSNSGPKTPPPSAKGPNDNPYATMSPYLSPFYTPPGNNDPTAKRSGEEPKYHRNLYFETLAKQMDEMQKQQEDEKNEPPPSTEPEQPEEINEPPEDASPIDGLDEQEIQDGENDVTPVE